MAAQFVVTMNSALMNEVRLQYCLVRSVLHVTMCIMSTEQEYPQDGGRWKKRLTAYIALHLHFCYAEYISMF